MGVRVIRPVLLWAAYALGPCGASVLRRSAFPASDAPCEGLECHVQYVSTPDDSYHWERLPDKFEGTETYAAGRRGAWKIHVLKMTSQTWLTANDSNASKWHHFVVVVVPTERNKTVANWVTLTVAGGLKGMLQHNMSHLTQKPAVQGTIQMALRTQAVAAVVLHDPNQPIVFAADPSHTARTEGQVRAFTWDMFLRNPNRPQVLAELPMVKAVARAMDTVQLFMAESETPVKRFGLIGCSKRALAAMFAAEIDPRVNALGVCTEILDRKGLIERSYQSYGATQDAYSPFFKSTVPDYYDTAVGDRLFGLIDAKTGIDKLTMPKQFIFAGNDAYFLVDADRGWGHDLPGESSFLTIPNADHIGDLKDSPPALQAASRFMSAVIHKVARPAIQWAINRTSGNIIVKQVSHHTPRSVKMWAAHSCGAGRRDFRFVTKDNAVECVKCQGFPAGPYCMNRNAVRWSSTELKSAPQSPNLWVAKLDAPESGWSAFFVHLTYDFAVPGHTDWEVTTSVSVVPNTYAFPKCRGRACYGDRTI